MATTTFIRQEKFYRRDSLIAGEDIDIDTYSRVGRYGEAAMAFLCSEAETPQFLFMETKLDGQAIKVAHLGHGQVQLTLSGSGIKGQKIMTADNGLIVAGGGQSGELGANDFGVALQDWADGETIECDILNKE